VLNDSLELSDLTPEVLDLNSHPLNLCTTSFFITAMTPAVAFAVIPGPVHPITMISGTASFTTPAAP
jgi:hypothetical protein